MREDLINKYNEFFDVMITEMSLEMGAHVKDYMVGKTTIKKSESVAAIDKEVIHRYGVNLTQIGENYVYSNIMKIEKLLKEKENMDKYDSKKEAKDIMCIYVLKHIYETCHIPFKSNYNKQLRNKKRTFNIKMAGFITFVVFVLVVIVCGVIALLS